MLKYLIRKKIIDGFIWNDGKRRTVSQKPGRFNRAMSAPKVEHWLGDVHAPHLFEPLGQSWKQATHPTANFQHTESVRLYPTLL